MTEHLYILGHPVAHSKSPAIYNAVYPELGLPWEYGSKDLADEGAARAFISERDYLSLNATTPYKPLALAMADAAAATAKLAGGANVLAVKDGVLLAYNVDGQGCVRYLERTGASFAGRRWRSAARALRRCPSCTSARRPGALRWSCSAASASARRRW